MGSLLSMVGGLLSLGVLVGNIIMLIQLFKAKGAGHAVAGFCCFFYTVYYTFTNADSIDAANPPIAGLKYKQIAIGTIAMWLGSMVLQGAGAAMMRM